MIDSPYMVKPGSKVRLDKIKPKQNGRFKSRKSGEKAAAKNLEILKQQQEVLYAQAKHAVLIVLQATDAGGKDGTIEHIFSGLNPQGCAVTSFKAPSTIERSHDFLWRHHEAAPPKGMIGIFNRSHYEAVLVERVRELAPKTVLENRYDAINHFEQMLTNEGTTILKFFLHISKEEQAERLQERLDDPQKHWKFNPNDLKERDRWDDYQKAYEEMLSRCSTRAAPWYVVPADRKWFRNYVISDVISRALLGLKLEFPKPVDDLSQYEVE